MYENLGLKDKAFILLSNFGYVIAKQTVDLAPTHELVNIKTLFDIVYSVIINTSGPNAGLEKTRTEYIPILHENLLTSKINMADFITTSSIMSAVEALLIAFDPVAISTMFPRTQGIVLDDMIPADKDSTLYSAVLMNICTELVLSYSPFVGCIVSGWLPGEIRMYDPELPLDAEKYNEDSYAYALHLLSKFWFTKFNDNFVHRNIRYIKSMALTHIKRMHITITNKLFLGIQSMSHLQQGLNNKIISKGTTTLQ